MLRSVNELGGVDRSLNSKTSAHRLTPDGDRPEAGAPFDDIAFVVAIAFHQHGHIGNVLTHICGRDWVKLEEALRSILDPRAIGPELSPLAQNIVELLCADRGVTGRIMRPYFHKLLTAILDPDAVAQLEEHIDVVFAEIGPERREQLPVGSAANLPQSPQEFR